MNYRVKKRTHEQWGGEIILRPIDSLSGELDSRCELRRPVAPLCVVNLVP